VTVEWECILAILQALADKGDAHTPIAPGQLPRWEEETVSYHMAMLEEQHLIVARVHDRPRLPLFCTATRLTFEGQALLGHMRNTSFWGRVIAEARKRALPLTLDLVKVATSTALRNIFADPPAGPRTGA